MTKTTVELPQVLHRKLRVKAVLEGRSMNGIIIAAVTEYLRNFRIEPDMLEVGTVTSDGNVKEGQKRKV